MRRLILFSIALMVATAALVGCNSNEMVAQPGSTPQPQVTQAPTDGAPRITPEELHKLWESNQVTIIDTRGEAAWEQSHIRGAIPMLANEVSSRVKELPRDKMIVAYCT